MPLWLQITLPIITAVAFFIVGFIVARMVFKKYLEKNPPINEDMIRAMMQQMGRTPTEKQVRQVMRSMQEAKDKDKKHQKPKALDNSKDKIKK